MFERDIKNQKAFFKKLEQIGIGKASVWYGGSHRWGDRTPYDLENRLAQSYIIFDNQVVFDLDYQTKEENKAAVQALQQALGSIPYFIIDTGGRGYHLNVFLKDPQMRIKFFERIVEKASQIVPSLKVDRQLITSKLHLVRAPFSYHEKTENQAVFLTTSFSVMSDIPNISFHSFSDSKEKQLTTAFYYNDRVLLQQIKGEQFILYDGNSFKKIEVYNEDGIHVKPLNGEEVEKGFIILADQPEDYSSTSELVEGIKQFSKKYLDIPENFRTLAAYFVILTWVYDKGNTVPYLRFIGDTGCGKSRALDVFGQLCYNFISVNGAANSAPIYRIIEKWKGTVGFEEADFKKSDETNDIVKIINCGWEKSKAVIRCEKNRPNNLNFFDAYCPKIFAMRKQFEDPATDGRCLTNIMGETQRVDIAPILPNSFYEGAKQLRNKLLCFRLKSFRKLNPDLLLPLPDTLEPRLKQMVAPFSLVFSYDNQDWKMFIDFLQDYQKQLKENRLNSDAGIVFTQILDLAVDTNEPVICKDVAEKIESTPSKVAKELKALGFVTEPGHRQKDGKRKSIRAILIGEDKWEVLCKRYLHEVIPIPPVLCQTRHACQTNENNTGGADGTLNTYKQ